MEVYIQVSLKIIKKKEKVKKRQQNIYMKVNLKMIKRMEMVNYHINYLKIHMKVNLKIIVLLEQEYTLGKIKILIKEVL